MSIHITAQDISMRFNERVLFYIPQLSIGPNDAIYLKGDNGVGKTTLLKIIAGLLKPTKGQLSQPSFSFLPAIFGRQQPRDVIYLHQSPYLFDGTVYQNVVYGIRYQSNRAKTGQSNHKRRKDKRAQVISALRMVGLETLADEHVSVLSGGEKQRVAMARAWVLKPSILLMDEPSASLDQESIDRLVIIAQDLLDRGSSLVITSHQSNALTKLCKKQWQIVGQTLVESPLLHVIPHTHQQESHYAATNAN